MLGSVHLLPGSDFVSGALALSVFLMGAVLAVLLVFGAFAFRRVGQAGTGGIVWRAALVLVGAVVAWALLDRSANREHAADRRAFDARVAELTARAIAPGSALACLDAVASATVEAACEKALFASPEATAAAVAYVDARFSLLSAGIALAARDPTYEPVLQRLRRAIESDRFGLVAHVLTTRGCNASDCADIKLMRDASRVLANMKARTFDAHVGMHGVAWHPPGTALAAAPPHAAEPAPSVASAPRPLEQTIGTGHGVPLSSKYDFPSSASIPAVSIMNAEPALPPEPRAAPAAPPPRQSSQPRRQSARETAPPASAPPMSVVPNGATQGQAAR